VGSSECVVGEELRDKRRSAKRAPFKINNSCYAVDIRGWESISCRSLTGANRPSTWTQEHTCGPVPNMAHKKAMNAKQHAAASMRGCHSQTRPFTSAMRPICNTATMPRLCIDIIWDCMCSCFREASDKAFHLAWIEAPVRESCRALCAWYNFQLYPSGHVVASEWVN